MSDQSEIASLLRQIREEYESAQLGLSGLAQGTSQHKFITTKMERIGEYHKMLINLVGDGAMALIVQQLDQTMSDVNAPIQ